MGANITNALNTTGNIPCTVDIAGEKRRKKLEFKRNVVFKVVDYLEAFMAWKSEMLKQFCVVVHIQWICPIAKNMVSFDQMMQAMN